MWKKTSKNDKNEVFLEKYFLLFYNIFYSILLKMQSLLRITNPNDTLN